MRKITCISLIALMCLVFMGCASPFAKVGEKAVTENRKNVEYLSEKLTGYYQKDLDKKILNQDDFNDRMVPVNEAKRLAKKIEESVKK